MPSNTDSLGSPDDVLSALGDELSRSILIQGTDEFVTAGRLAETLGVSETTVYRRLNRLDSLGLLTEVTDVRVGSSSENTYRTNVGALVVSLSSAGVSVTEGSTALEAALSVLLDRVDVTEATFSFEDGTVTATMSMDDETLEELQASYRATSADGASSPGRPNL